tara:strand:+ start:315 stop:752 length:438 start_codon:yes stop_codon:yes gene_type:complete
MSKPILSELEYNASDVASAILSQADLSVTNEDFGVTDISSEYTATSGWNINSDSTAFSFNGFIFVSFLLNHAGGEPSDGEKFMDVSADYKPVAKSFFPTVSHQADTGYNVSAKTDGGFYIALPHAPGADVSFYVVFNGFYRYTAV